MAESTRPVPERFDHYMDRCLYDEATGFYNSGGVAGRRGDFITSPEVGPLFGLLLGRLLDSWWDEQGQPERLNVFDVGSGPGTLLRTLEAGKPRCSEAWTLAGVDRSGPYAENSLPQELSGSIVIANELLDNMAFRIVERKTQDEWFEVFVHTDPNGDGTRRTEKLVAIDPPGFEIPTGSRAPWHETAVNWIRDIRERGASKILVFDYGAPTTTELAARGGWLRTYSNHSRGSDPYVTPGSCDITTDIGFDQFPQPATLTTQAELLNSLGIKDLVAEGKTYWKANAARPNLEAMKMRSRVAEAEALCDPDGLGSWQVAIW